MPKNITMSLVVVSLLACQGNEVTTSNKRTAELDVTKMQTNHSDTTQSKEWIDVADEDSTFIIVMPYASKENFLKEKIYPCAKCYLRTDAANALLKAQKEALSKGLKIVLYDCYRPLPLQQKMFDIKPDTKYVADPKHGSKHNKGVAIDVGLADLDGKVLEMGTDFDDFSAKANYHAQDVSAEARKNRKLLRDIMLSNEYLPYDGEWWHFNYKKTDYPNEDFVWECDD